MTTACFKKSYIFQKHARRPRQTSLTLSDGPAAGYRFFMRPPRHRGPSTFPLGTCQLSPEGRMAILTPLLVSSPRTDGLMPQPPAQQPWGRKEVP